MMPTRFFLCFQGRTPPNKVERTLNICAIDLKYASEHFRYWFCYMGPFYIVSSAILCMRNEEFRLTGLLREQRGMAKATNLIATAFTINIVVPRRRNYYYVTFLHVFVCATVASISLCVCVSVCLCACVWSFHRLFELKLNSGFFTCNH